MSLDYITAGQGLEVIIFWSIGAFVLGVGAIDTWWKGTQCQTKYDL